MKNVVKNVLVVGLVSLVGLTSCVKNNDLDDLVVEDVVNVKVKIKSGDVVEVGDLTLSYDGDYVLNEIDAPLKANGTPRSGRWFSVDGNDYSLSFYPNKDGSVVFVALFSINDGVATFIKHKGRKLSDALNKLDKVLA